MASLIIQDTFEPYYSSKDTETRRKKPSNSVSRDQSAQTILLPAPVDTTSATTKAAEPLHRRPVAH